MPFTKGHTINIGRKHSKEFAIKVSLAQRKRIKKFCVICTKEFEIIPSQKNIIKCCSYRCMCQLRKGRTPWNKGLKGFMAGTTHHWYGKDSGDEKSPTWKGNRVGYRGLHLWVEKHLGKPQKCEHCGLDGIPKGMKRYFQWANKSGNYLRELNDWLRLCVKCHKVFDGYGIGENGN